MKGKRIRSSSNNSKLLIAKLVRPANKSQTSSGRNKITTKPSRHSQKQRINPQRNKPQDNSKGLAHLRQLSTLQSQLLRVGNLYWRGQLSQHVRAVTEKSPATQKAPTKCEELPKKVPKHPRVPQERRKDILIPETHNCQPKLNGTVGGYRELIIALQNASKVKQTYKQMPQGQQDAADRTHRIERDSVRYKAAPMNQKRPQKKRKNLPTRNIASRRAHLSHEQQVAQWIKNRGTEAYPQHIESTIKIKESRKRKSAA